MHLYQTITVKKKTISWFLDGFSLLVNHLRHQTQWETLQALDERMKKAELQVEQILAAMATVDSQVKLIVAQDVESSRSEHLRADIREQIERLNDLISSINEVYDYHSRGLV